MDTTDDLEATAPLNITVTSEASEVLTWRMLVRQAVPMLERPEQFHIAQRKQLAQTISLLLGGDLELEHVFGDTNDGYEPGCCDEDEQERQDEQNGRNTDPRKEPW